MSGRFMSESSTAPRRAKPEPPALSEAELPRRGRSKARRLGCGLALLFWFSALLAPCALFYLAANGEIRLQHRDIPQPHAHPLLLISLVSEAEDRGLRIESSWIADAAADEETLCVETAVRFLLWEHRGGNQNVSFCDCYMRQDAEADWEFATTAGGVC